MTIDQEDVRQVGFIIVFAFASGYFLRPHVICSFRRRDLLKRSGKRNDRRSGEFLDVAFERGGRVAFRIHRYERDVCIRNTIERLAELCKRCRTRIGTMCIPEKERRFAVLRRERPRMAVLIGEYKIRRSGAARATHECKKRWRSKPPEGSRHVCSVPPWEMQFAVLFLRLILGTLLVITGALKVGHAPELAAAIAGFRLLPPAVIAPLALLLPFLEILIGGYLVVGLFTRITAWIACAQLALYAAAIASAVVRGIAANCGCFGPNDVAVADWPHVAFDLSLAVVAAILALYAPGAFSLDRRIHRS